MPDCYWNARVRTYAALVVGCAIGLGCGELPDPATPGGQPAGADDDVPSYGDNDVTGDTTAPEAPDVEGLPTQYGFLNIPLRGFAEPNSIVSAESGGRAETARADQGGNFCIDMVLEEDANNQIEIRAQDEAGNVSEPTYVSVRHDPDLAPEPADPEPVVVNAAAGRPVYSEGTPKLGSLMSLTDGSVATDATLYKSRIWVDLGQTFNVTAVELVFIDTLGDGDDTFATEYEVLASNVLSPAIPPDAESTGWSLLFDVYPDASVAAGDGGTDTLTLSTPFLARYVAAYLIENNKTDWFDSENIRVAEFRVYAEVVGDDDEPTELEAPTCENGASVQ